MRLLHAEVRRRCLAKGHSVAELDEPVNQTAMVRCPSTRLTSAPCPFPGALASSLPLFAPTPHPPLSHLNPLPSRSHP